MARNSAPATAVHSASTRCAIYTRKSSEDGLEQEFNWLHAQREACLAYISSQRHEGWKAPTRYDDGGFSGGTLNRPAVQQLLAEIRAGRVDLVVIYKVDRLTRSLANFAKLVDEGALVLAPVGSEPPRPPAQSPQPLAAAWREAACALTKSAGDRVTVSSAA